MIKVIVNGAKGKMGQETVKAVNSHPELELVCQSDKEDDFSDCLSSSKANVAVDFTTADSSYENVVKIIEAGVHPVIGTTGFTEQQVSELQVMANAKNLGGVIAPNFAIGAVLMMKFAADAAKYMPSAEIVEIHHDRKADYPSGTAVRTGELMTSEKEMSSPLVNERATLEHARGASLKGLRIHSLRLPGVVARQQVILGGLGQTLTIEHNSISRESFMPGVCLACQKVVTADQLYFGLEHLL